MNLIQSASLILVVFLCSLCQQKESSTDDATTSPQFERLSYNNPDLAVDLGVGLWAWPLPMDYDGDGDYDLLVSCRDVPFNGVYFFENTTGEAFPVFNPPVKIGEALKDIQVSYVDGTPRFLQPGKELLNFKTSLAENTKPLYRKSVV